MVRIGVLVSGGGTNLQQLIDAQATGRLGGGEIVTVISSKPGVYALERAQKAGIEAIALSRKDYPDVEVYSQALIDALKARNVELVVLSGFLTITSDSFVQAFPNRIMNVHPALLPAFGGKGYYGLHVHEAVLSRGCKLTGATVHFANEVCDGGPIILQKAVAVQEGDTPESLQKRVMEQAEWTLLPEAVSLFCQGRLRVEDGKVSIAPAHAGENAGAAPSEGVKQ
jgi:phosphoribosylglycinamide formyltransferase-1